MASTASVPRFGRDRLLLEKMSTSSRFEDPSYITCFEEFCVALEADTPTLRNIVGKCTKVRTSCKTFTRLVRSISKATNSHAIINFMRVYWGEITSISDKDKKLISTILESIHKKRMCNMDPCDSFYDGGARY
jgi:hypothetical protein